MCDGRIVYAVAEMKREEEGDVANLPNIANKRGEAGKIEKEREGGQTGEAKGVE
jgi:hypothetical protein